MRLRRSIWILLCLLVLAGGWLFWPAGHHRALQKLTPAQSARVAQQQAVATTKTASTAPVLFGSSNSTTNGVVKTNRFAYRLTNTTKTIGQLAGDPRAILLENALIDTSASLNLGIPKHLQAAGDPGAYIVQANRPSDAAFRAQLAAAGAQIVSYIPNNAYLVRVTAGGAAALAGEPGVQTVLPYEPLYKISSVLLGPAVEQKNLPTNTVLTLGLFGDNATATEQQIQKLGGTVVATDRSPFGPIVRVVAPENWTALAALPGVQIVEMASRRTMANDLARVSLGISTDTVTNANYLGLSGSNVVVEVNDTGIDQAHPDFTAAGNAETGPSGPTRVFGATALSLVDADGHGTHVAGIIAGNGAESYTVTNIPQGSVTNADFRGKAPAASLYSFQALNNDATLDASDYVLQSIPALTNALISNNSWVYSGDGVYDLAAAGYDAAVRDALPLVTGSQPVLFVFAAGNDGVGDDNGSSGEPDTIRSPATAKDVITVGALEQMRNITNTYTPADSTNEVAVWQDGTDSGFQVAGYSSRGNVGIGSEGDFGRFKPDVVAPGSFVVSTRSAQWDTTAYYNPTNYYYNEYDNQILDPNGAQFYNLPVPGNAVGVKITLFSDGTTQFPTNLLIYVRQADYPDLDNYDFITSNNVVSIPPDGGPAYLTTILTNGFFYAVANPTNFAVAFDIVTQITTTNDNGNYFEVLSNLNETLAPYYRYESGTSMAAPAVSGTLALIQDYFTNTLHATPSPALLKAMLINGARAVGNYNFVVTNGINFQGWGQPNVPSSVPPGVTNQLMIPCSSFFLDQSPTNALATGDSQSWQVTVDTNSTATTLPLRVTLAWTDPPGNPSAAIKLVNNLDLMVSNNATGDVYFGNDFPSGSRTTAAWDTNAVPNLDYVNNVENVFLPSAEGGSYTVTVIGRSVNVNAVTAQTDNVVQDFALVISSGSGEVTNAITVTPPSAPNLAAGPLVTVVTTTNTLLMNQIAGGNTPLLGTNTVGAGPGFSTSAVITLGMTNQWHFYVVTNTLGFTNAAFITFLSQTLATPRMGVFATESQNPTQPDADIDLYVAGPNDPNASSLTNLDPTVISNCVHGVYGDAAALTPSGTEFVAYTNSALGDVYYIGVKSETQVAAEFDFLPVFSEVPFSIEDPNGVTVNGLLLPVALPDGTPAHPGVAYVFGLAIQSVEIQNVIITNTFFHQNFADLVGVLTHDGNNVVLNNHNGSVAPGFNTFIYDNGPAPVIGSQPPDGPGSLQKYQGQQSIGPWILTEVDNSFNQTGAVTGLTIRIEKHFSLTDGIFVTLPPGGYFYGYLDVPVGATNLTIAATNVSGTVTPGGNFTAIPLDPTGPGKLYEKLGQQPTPPPEPLTNYDQMVSLTNSGPTGPGGLITVDRYDTPPIQPGRYFATLWNDSSFAQVYYIIATLGVGKVDQVDFNAAGSVPILDDAVSYAYITNFPTASSTNETIATISVGLRVDHERISDLVFHLISPDGTRYLLMENRGGTSTNGAGATIVTTNIVNSTSAGSSDPSTNFIPVGLVGGTLAVSYNFFTVPDQMTVYYGTNNFSAANLAYDTTMTNGTGQLNLSFPAGTGNLTIIMNQFGNTNGVPGSDLWTYTAGGVQTNFLYLSFTEDTNLTTTPIKFAPTPFVPDTAGGILWTDSFESYLPGTYTSAASFGGGWSVLTNQVEIGTGALANFGANYLQLDDGAVAIVLSNTVAGQEYVLSYQLGTRATDSGGPPTNANWQAQSFKFIPTQGNPLLVLNASGLTLTNANTVMLAFDTNSLVDDFTLTAVPGNLYYQPEESLDPLIGASAYGLWTLEIQDDRVGATNVAPTLLDWQLQFVFANTNPAASVLIPGGPITNTVPAFGVLWYRIDVPTNADFATNTLIFADLPVNLLFNQTVPDTNGAAVLLPNSTGGSNILSATSVPPLMPGSSYYLGVQNPNNVPVDFGLEVDFHLITYVAPPIDFSSIVYTNSNGTNGYLLTWFAPTNDIFQVQWSDFFPPAWTSFTNVVVYTGPPVTPPANGTFTYFDDGSQTPPGLPAMRYYNLILLGTLGDITNGVPETETVPAGSIAYFAIQVPANADSATNNLIAAGLPVNLLFNQTTPPAGANPGDYLLLTNSTGGISVLNTTNVPPLIPGATYYLGVQNTNTTAVTFTLEVNFHVLPPIVLSSIISTNGGFQLTWFAPTNDQFDVRWTTNLVSPVTWTVLNGSPITSTTGTFTFLDTNAPVLMKFYELILRP